MVASKIILYHGCRVWKTLATYVSNLIHILHVLSADAMTMTGEIESEGTGVGLDRVLLDDLAIDDLGLAPRKGKGSLAIHSAP